MEVRSHLHGPVPGIAHLNVVTGRSVSKVIAAGLHT
jgi:hypothetical protein